MITNNYNKVAVRLYSFLFPLVFCLFLFSSCVDLEYTEENSRDEEWTFTYFNEGIKGLVSGVYAQIYNNEFESNSAYFLAGATDEAQYALETGAVNNYVNGGWSPANPFDRAWSQSYTAIADVNMYLEKIDQTDIDPLFSQPVKERSVRSLFDLAARIEDQGGIFRRPVKKPAVFGLAHGHLFVRLHITLRGLIRVIVNGMVKEKDQSQYKNCRKQNYPQCFLVSAFLCHDRSFLTFIP